MAAPPELASIVLPRQAHRVVEGLGSRGGHVRADARRTPTLVVTLTTVGPTTPAKVVAPVVFTARVKAPFTVEFREMAAPPELVSAVAAVRLTGSLYAWVLWWSRSRRCSSYPRVGRHAHHRRTHHAANVVAPAVFTAKAKAPFTVELKAMARSPVLVSVVLPARSPRSCRSGFRWSRGSPRFVAPTPLFMKFTIPR